MPPDLLSAFLLCQLEAREIIQKKRRKIWQRYHLELSDWACAIGAQLPTVPEYVEQPYHMFYVILPTPADRPRFIAYLADNGIQAVFHYAPLNASPMGSRFGAKQGDCPVAEGMSMRLVRLPFFTGMSSSEQDLIIKTIQQFRCG
jgi:dTDP-4-amino-4,6-dideoxygalactose transaminase